MEPFLFIYTKSCLCIKLFVDFYFRFKVTAVKRAGSCLTAQPERLLQQFPFFVFVPLKCHKSNIEQIKENMFLDPSRWRSSGEGIDGRNGCQT